MGLATFLNAIFIPIQNIPSSPESTFSFHSDLQFIQICGLLPIRNIHLFISCHQQRWSEKGQSESHSETAATDNKLGQPIILLPRAICQGVTKKSQQCTEVLLCIDPEKDLLNSKS